MPSIDIIIAYEDVSFLSICFVQEDKNNLDCHLDKTTNKQ